MTAHDRAVEAAERAGVAEQGCGYNVGGKQVLCCDPVMDGHLDPYGKPMRREHCDCREAARAAISAYLASMREQGWEMVEQPKDFPSLDDAFDAAWSALQTYADAANEEECNWTGWGEQTIPPHATMRRVKAEQALDALRDSDAKRAKMVADRAFAMLAAQESQP